MNEQPACVPYSLDVMVYCAEQRLQRFIEASAKEHSRAVRFQFSVARGSMAVRHVREDVAMVIAQTSHDMLRVLSAVGVSSLFATGGLVSDNAASLLQGAWK